jgi:beta-lactamase class A
MPQARRPSPQAIARRRAGQKRLGLLLAGVLVVIAVVISSTGHSPAKARNSAAKKATVAKTHVPAAVDPLTTPAVKKWIAGRTGDVSAAVLNLNTGKEWLLNPGARDQTASIIKADILETLLYQTRKDDDSIADAEGEVPEGMIEASDNADATQLWDQIGGATGLSAYNALAGLTQTTPNTQGFWGETLTSAADQIKILEQLAKPTKLLSKQAVAYQLSLMTDIDPGENWGVTGGVPKGVTVALKNGWVPLTSNTDWEVNSIGWIKGDDHDYLLAVLTAHDPSEDYGIATIKKIAASVYATLGTEGLKSTAGTSTTKSSSKKTKTGTTTAT